MSIGQRIKKERTRLGLSQEAVAKAVSSSKQLIYKYENEIVTNIPMEKIEKMASLFNVTPTYLMGWEESTDITHFLPNARPIVRKRLPMLGNVACGEPIFADESHEAYVDADNNMDADFCLTAQGDSMINARIFNGDVLFVKSQPTIDNGEIAVVLIDDEATVKRVYYDRENNILTLIPENPLYKPMRYEGDNLDRIRILGKVVSGKYQIN